MNALHLDSLFCADGAEKVRMTGLVHSCYEGETEEEEYEKAHLNWKRLLVVNNQILS